MGCQFAAESRHIADAAEVNEAFVDRIDLDVRSSAADERHDAPRHVAVERHVRRTDGDGTSLDHAFDTEERDAHGYAECLGLVTARDDTAVVVRQDDDGFADELRAEYTLTADEEVVTVDEADHEGGGGHDG